MLGIAIVVRKEFLGAPVLACCSVSARAWRLPFVQQQQSTAAGEQHRRGAARLDGGLQRRHRATLSLIPAVALGCRDASGL
jgi:hypothetical protein